MSVNIAGYPGAAFNITLLLQCTPSPCLINLAVINYIPSLPANATFTALFSLFLLIQVSTAFIYKTWTYALAICLGLAFEILGYLARIQMHFNIFSTEPFILQITTLTISPFFYTLSIYLTLSHLIHHYGPHNSRLTPKAYTLTFLTFDLIALILQSVGGGLANAASTLDSAQIGVNVMVGGLAFQGFSMTVFVLLCGEFFWNVRGDRRQIRNTDWAARKVACCESDGTGFKIFIAAFTLTTLLILIRSIFRLAELVHGFSSPLANNEAAFMVFEGGIMIVSSFLMTMYHPGRFLREEWRTFRWGGRKGAKDSEIERFEECDPKPVERPVFNRPWPL